MPVTIYQAISQTEIEQARNLFLEYAASLGFSLCFQGFDQELAELPGKYAPPEGRLMLARSDAVKNPNPAGCVGIHKLGTEICEMKRLYVRPAFRALGMGSRLAEAAVSAAREIGYRRMRLDTVPSKMASAVKMYRGMGFREIAPYTANPVPGAIFMELEL
jgi:ribosomal protein S18 acetylase RimI-like enzyme